VRPELEAKLAHISSLLAAYSFREAEKPISDLAQSSWAAVKDFIKAFKTTLALALAKSGT
jgi:hypothetical protein